MKAKKDDLNKEQEEFAKTEGDDVKGLKISETLLYKVLVKIAYQIINKPLAVFRLIKQSIKHLKRYESVKEFTEEVKDQVATLMRLVQSYAKGDYREISVRNLALTIAALLYFVAPIDFIPDFLPLGLIDDIAILMWVYKNYSGEIDAFREWEDSRKVRIELPTNVEEEQA